MFSKKFLVFLLSLIILASFSFGAFAASGQGYFGPGNGDNYNLEEEDDFEDEDDYADKENEEEDDYVTVPPAPPENNDYHKEVIEDQKYRVESTYWEKRNIKPEQRSQDANTIIKSYKLNPTDDRILREKHKSAGNSAIGKREQAQRYARIFTLYPYDYFAAYRVAQLNFEMQRYSTAKEWINKSVAVYPDYVPAKKLYERLGEK